MLSDKCDNGIESGEHKQGQIWPCIPYWADELRLIKYAHIHQDVFLFKILNINLCVVFKTSCCSNVYNKTKQKPFYIPPRQSSPV